MHQKMAIFKEENSVCRGTKFSNITKWHYFLDEPNLKLKNKTCQEISKITKWHYFLDELNLKFKTKHVIIIIDKCIFWDSWQKLVSKQAGAKDILAKYYQKVIKRFEVVRR